MMMTTAMTKTKYDNKKRKTTIQHRETNRHNSQRDKPRILLEEEEREKEKQLMS